jgi:hypothetical protein
MADPLYMVAPFFIVWLQIRDSAVKRSEGYARQRHEPAHMKNAVQEPEKIRVFVLRYNLAHNVRNAFSGDTRNAAANGNIDTGLDTYAPGFDANTSLFQGKVSKSKGLSVKRRGKVVTASGGKLHLDNLFC